MIHWIKTILYIWVPWKFLWNATSPSYPLALAHLQGSQHWVISECGGEVPSGVLILRDTRARVELKWNVEEDVETKVCWGSSGANACRVSVLCAQSVLGYRSTTRPGVEAFIFEFLVKGATSNVVPSPWHRRGAQAPSHSSPDSPSPSVLLRRDSTWSAPIPTILWATGYIIFRPPASLVPPPFARCILAHASQLATFIDFGHKVDLRFKVITLPIPTENYLQAISKRLNILQFLWSQMLLLFYFARVTSSSSSWPSHGNMANYCDYCN